MGLKEKIKTAKSAWEIQCLLSEGFFMRYASPDTKRKWERAAKRSQRKLRKLAKICK